MEISKDQEVTFTEIDNYMLDALITEIPPHERKEILKWGVENCLESTIKAVIMTCLYLTIGTIKTWSFHGKYNKRIIDQAFSLLSKGQHIMTFEGEVAHYVNALSLIPSSEEKALVLSAILDLVANFFMFEDLKAEAKTYH